MPNMSNSTEFEISDNSNEWVNWIEDAIAKNYLKYYEYEHFSNIQEIGSGSFGKVYRANWKNTSKYLTLKSFFNLNNTTIKELVRELKFRCRVGFHDNIIHFYGITSSDQDDPNDQLKRYSLVMEYVDGVTLQTYLKENFVNLTWNDKFNLAFQLAYVVSCLHEEGITHHDLHSGSVLVHQNTIKLTDFGLAKRIEEASNSTSKSYGIIPYIDPNRFNRRRSNNSPIQVFSLNEKSDVYSVGILLWEISSGRPPFYNEDGSYDIGLAVEILKGQREIIVPNTPTDYVNLYTECWDGDSDNRPTMNQVVARLKSMISVTSQPKTVDGDDSGANIQISNKQNKEQSNPYTIEDFTSFNNSLHNELSQIIQNFDNLSIKVIIESLTLLDKRIINKNILLEKKFDKIVDEIIDLILKKLNKGMEKRAIKQYVLDNYFDSHNISSQEIYDWLLNNQYSSNSIFLLGYFNYYGIEINENKEKAFNLFINASEQNHTLAQYYVGLCFELGVGTEKNKKLAFEYYKKIANKYCVGAELKVGYFYNEGIGIEKDAKLAIYWYKKAVNHENLVAMYNLAIMYKNGDNVEKDYDKAFELFKKSAEGEYTGGITMLGYCYKHGIGTNIDMQKAFELYQKAANLKDNVAQFNLARMYRNGKGAERDDNKAFELFKKSAEGGHTNGIAMLGYCYDNGIGTNVNKQKAFELYQRAANLGDNVSQYNLAIMYKNGIGAERDDNKAFELFKKSAEEGHTNGIAMLGYCYKNKIGTNVNKQEAFELYQKAANLGNCMAQYNLGLMYEDGDGVIQDINQAIYWYKESAKEGHQDAQKRLEELSSFKSKNA